MSTLVTVAHVVVAVALIVIVLLQQGKGAAMGAAFGGSSQTLFGSRGPASALAKITTGAAIIFMLTSLTLSAMSSGRKETSVIPAGPATLPVELPADDSAKASQTKKDPASAATDTGGPLDESAGSKPGAAGPVNGGSNGKNGG
ncbi:MAG: preprotein translocase subunit SecG [Nitrospinae bacterium]|nr:preprotein translocase subunit SecG [Nitrospinota bacterium]